MQINVDTSCLIEFLSTFSVLNDYVTLKVDRDCISGQITSPDNTIVLFGKMQAHADQSRNLNIPDITRFVRILKNINEPNISLNIKSNNIVFSHEEFNFKYHLLEDGLMQAPVMTYKKVDNFDLHVNFNIDTDTFKRIKQLGSFVNDVAKVYFLTREGHLYAQMTDKARDNVDMYEIRLIENVDFNLNPFAFNIENLRLINSNNSINVGINTEFGVAIIKTTTDTQNTYTYAATSYVS